MRNLIILITAITLLSSCKAYKDKICLSCPTKIEIKDTTIYKEKIKHDTEYVSVPGPEILIPSPCDSTGKLKPFKRTERKNGLISTVENINGYIVAKCDADSLMRVNKTLERTIERFRSEVREVPTCHLEHISKMDNFFIILGRILSVIILLLLVYVILKFWLKLNLP